MTKQVEFFLFLSLAFMKETSFEKSSGKNEDLLLLSKNYLDTINQISLPTTFIKRIKNEFEEFI